jgi:hypothetical protein
MVVVNVGSRSADEVLNSLFERQATAHQVGCFALVRPMSAPQFFSELIGNWGTSDSMTSRHMAFVVFNEDHSGVVTRLMALYDIHESALPCILFTDGNDRNKYLVVQLDAREPLKFLQEHVLKPLSREFATLSKYWGRRGDSLSPKGKAQRATDAVAQLRSEIAKVTAEIERQTQLVPEQIRNEQEQLDLRKRERQQELAVRAQQRADQGKVVQKLAEELDNMVRRLGQFRSPEEQPQEMAKLSKRLFRERQRLDAYTKGEDLREETDRMRRLRTEIEQLRDRIPALELRKKQIEADLERENKAAERYSPHNLEREQAAIGQMAKELKAAGYGPEVLDAERPSVFAAIQVMFQRGLIGIPAQQRQPGNAVGL